MNGVQCGEVSDGECVGGSGCDRLQGDVPVPSHILGYFIESYSNSEHRDRLRSLFYPLYLAVKEIG